MDETAKIDELLVLLSTMSSENRVRVLLDLVAEMSPEQREDFVARVAARGQADADD